MNKVLLVGRLTRDPELRSLPSGKPVATFSVATNEYRGGGGERTEYHACVAWDRLAEICGQFLSKGQLVDVEGRLQTRNWDDDAGKRQCQVSPPAPTKLDQALNQRGGALTLPTHHPHHQAHPGGSGLEALL